MATAHSLLKAKHSEKTYKVHSDDTVFKALELMRDANISAVLVEAEDKIVGIFTERDYTRKIELMDRTAKNTTIREVMTEMMVTVRTNATVDECMALMLKYSVRHLPVVDNGQIIGVLSMRDIVEETLHNKNAVIAQLENYIMGSSFPT